ncbi:hypothetical protein FOXYSP1_19028 [Fusarium oxysporum f. sp. phaseoli]
MSSILVASTPGSRDTMSIAHYASQYSFQTGAAILKTFLRRGFISDG